MKIFDFQTISQVRDALLEKRVSAFELTKLFLNHIAKKDPEVGAFLHVFHDEALGQAKDVDVKIARGEEPGLLAGCPVAMKDNILVQGAPTTAGSKILETYEASYDATATERLRAAGAVFVGKTNLDEFAMGSSTENSAFHVTKNPHDTSRVAGGSSGGSAAAVSAHEAVISLGSDTGGSIRQPASFCGVVGLKPTYGAVSRYGLIALASSLDQIGPFSRTVRDSAIAFRVIAGSDTHDATSRNISYGDDLVDPDLESVKKLTIGIPKEYFEGGLQDDVREAVEKAIESIKSLGLRFKKISLPNTKYALPCYYIIMPAEASSNLARFDGVRYSRIESLQDEKNLAHLYVNQRKKGFGAEAKRRIILGTFVLSSGYYDAYYAKAQKVRALVARDFENAFKEVDVILGPVAPTPAFKIGEKADDPLAMYLSDALTIPANLAGLPGVSIPVRDLASGSLPIGFQLIGRHFREADILGVGQFYDRIFGLE